MSGAIHNFSVNVAAVYGLSEAVIINDFVYWISINRRKGINQHEGRTWTFQTIEQIASRHPYLTSNQVREIMDKLCSGKWRRSKSDDLEHEPILVKGNFNKVGFDQTTWYAFLDEERWVPIESWAIAQMDSHRELGNCPNAVGPLPKPIPDITPNITKNPPNPPEGGERGASPPGGGSVSSDSKKDEEAKKEVHPGVHLTTSQEIDVISRCKALKIDPKDAYLILAKWKADTVLKRSVCDYRQLVTWAIERASEKPKDNTADNRDLAVTIASSFPNFFSPMDVGYNYITFRNGAHAVDVEFTDPKFREKCKQQLQNRGVVMPE